MPSMKKELRKDKKRSVDGGESSDLITHSKEKKDLLKRKRLKLKERKPIQKIQRKKSTSRLKLILLFLNNPNLLTILNKPKSKELCL